LTPAFLDTSAILALMNPKDELHPRARRAFEVLGAEQTVLVTTSLVLVETYALLGRRLGLAAVRAFRTDLAPLAEITWVDEPTFESGLDLLLARKKRHLSLVDTVSFLVMRQRGLERAFAFDPHFEEEGFALVG
jgi:predicted nucleic acid-binding protein